MAESIVILTPYVRREQVRERRDRLPPRNFTRSLQPLGMLVKHGIDNVDKSLVAGEQAVPAGEKITFEPALAHVLAQHLHYPAIGRYVIIVGQNHPVEGAVGHLKNRI